MTNLRRSLSGGDEDATPEIDSGVGEGVNDFFCHIRCSQDEGVCSNSTSNPLMKPKALKKNTPTELNVVRKFRRGKSLYR